MNLPRGACCAALLLSVWSGCTNFEFETTTAPVLEVATPAAYEDPSGYFAAGFSACWEATAVEVVAAARSDKEVMAALLFSFRVGWATSYQPRMHAKPPVWFVLTPGVGVWTWSDSPEPFGFAVSGRTGIRFHLNDYNTFGVEYGVLYLQGSHDDDATSMGGVFVSYSVLF